MMDVMYRHVTTIAALPKGQHEVHLNAVRERLEESAETLELPSETGWIDLMIKTMRAMITEIDTASRGGNGKGLSSRPSRRGRSICQPSRRSRRHS
jgi:hypothetical protein